ncbi:TetR/AcrR family transcriptional regulator [Saccharopolyspora sp. K220]|uniref:TetR/AcrR family transcriptional regulator n=1 Tax=Saccharopolyspora soli TaxID=2926618 RepID=UPI001F57D986|nr:TetR/AcrR family transcriptional regulator [Saccharopolyspora soli]MCI2421399.1 TetR/AcrR family transcriptional regulator [Saccharopolyspora soli]
MSSSAREDDPKRSAVLAAAVEVFGWYGFQKMSMEAVAKAAGISRPGLYPQFPNKEQLYRDTMQGVMDVLFAAAMPRQADRPPAPSSAPGSGRPSD